MHNLIKIIHPRTVLIAILTFFLGWQLGHKDVTFKWDNLATNLKIENSSVPQNLNVDFKLFWETWNLLNTKYLDKKALDPEKMFYGAISGMVASLGDPYTVFLPPQQQKSSKEELGGSFEGVGIQLGFDKDKRLVVIAPLDGTPAKEAGIKPLDLIIKIDEKDTTNMTLPDAVDLIRGPRGTNIELTIYREGEKEPKIFNLVRRTIVVKSVELSFKQNKAGKNIAVINLSRFGERTEGEWDEAVSQIIDKKADGLVLDLRNNPGGYLEGAVFIASEFLSSGPVVLQEDARGEKLNFNVNRTGKLLDIPLVALINKGSASASEIVAGALQDKQRAKLVGEKSFGKGTIQEAQELSKNTGIHITIAKWLTPKGRWVNELGGLSPDIEVKTNEEDIKDATKDPQMEKALELFN